MLSQIYAMLLNSEPLPLGMIIAGMFITDEDTLNTFDSWDNIFMYI